MNQLQVTIDGQPFQVSVDLSRADGNVYTVMVDGEAIPVTLPQANGRIPDIEWMIIDDRPYELICNQDLSRIKDYSGYHRVEIRDLAATTTRPPSGDGRIKAPIPGLIGRVLVQPGDVVKVEDPILILEAMKMENEIRATTGGTVTAVHVQPGHTVIRGEVLAEIV